MASYLYPDIDVADLDVDYLDDIATSHKSPFGALVEFVDNSRDASAKNLKIYSKPKPDDSLGELIYFLDDGEGMSPSTAKKCMTFGHSKKKNDDKYIGRYGQGMKSGAMHVTLDFMIFTKKDNICTIVFVSKTFLDRECLEKILVPCPSFDAVTKHPYLDAENNMRKHEKEMEIILKYSPFKTKTELFKNFDSIEGHSGTLIALCNIIFNSRTGRSIIEIDKNAKDLISKTNLFNDNEPKENKSFREYLSVLYTDPKMKIYIESSKVRTKPLKYYLYKPMLYKYDAARLCIQSTENEIRQCQERIESILNKQNSAFTDYKQIENKHKNARSLDAKKEKNKANNNVIKLKEMVESHKKRLDYLKRNKNVPKIIEFIIGLNIHNRFQEGFYIYNSHRLITIKKTSKIYQTNLDARGIVGMVDIPYSNITPGISKQFLGSDDVEKKLHNIFEEHLNQYLSDVVKEFDPRRFADLKSFWEKMGYINGSYVPKNEELDKLKRMYAQKVVIQCDSCLKWRVLRDDVKNVDKVFKDDWCCKDQTNCANKSCECPEGLQEIIEKKLIIVPKTNENSSSRVSTAKTNGITTSTAAEASSSSASGSKRNEPTRVTSSQSSILIEKKSSNTNANVSPRDLAAKRFASDLAREIDQDAPKKAKIMPEPSLISKSSKHPEVRKVASITTTKVSSNKTTKSNLYKNTVGPFSSLTKVLQSSQAQTSSQPGTSALLTQNNAINTLNDELKLAQQKIEELEKRFAVEEKRNSELEKRNDELKNRNSELVVTNENICQNFKELLNKLQRDDIYDRHTVDELANIDVGPIYEAFKKRVGEAMEAEKRKLKERYDEDLKRIMEKKN